MQDTVRKRALRLLCAWEAGERFINLSLSPAVTEGLSPRDRGLLTALLYGTVERSLTLDYYIGKLARREAAGLAPHTRNLLRLGLYQLLYMDGIPAFAAVRETVALASHAGERGFANAILRAATRAPGELVPPPRERNPYRHLSVAHAVPLWLVRLFCEQYGDEMGEALTAAANRGEGLTLRVNTRRISRAALLDMLRAAGYAAVPTPYAPTGIRLEKSENPTALPGFGEGYFYIQDEASQIAVLAADAAGLVQNAADPVRSGESAPILVDTCACPGGKSFGLAIEAGDGGEIYSFDLHESKLPLITAGAERLGLSAIRTSVRDARMPDPTLIGRAARVVCDAPCSGLGVIAKKPDLRYRPQDGVSELPALQAEILASAAQYVAPGGLLLYTTCTVNRAENGGVCSEFLKNHPDFMPEDFAVGSLSSSDGQLQLLPPIHQTDGFFIARFRRKESI